MKNLTLFFAILFSVITIYGQKRSFDERVQYQTGNKDGKNLTIDFEAIYDTYLGDPIYKERAKVISEGDFIMFNGEKYFKNDIGQVVFNKVSTGLLNIQYDIYQGSSRISTLRRNNVYTSKGLVPYGFFWRTLWPGVSAENAKNIYKEGFTIRNVKIYNVKFNMYPLKDLLAKRKREEEAKKREEERLRIEAENKKIEKDRLEKIEKDNKKIEVERLRVEEEKRKKREEKLDTLEKDAIKIQEDKENARKERYKIEKEARDKKFEIEKKQREKQREIDAKEAADNAAVRRRLAKRRKEAQDRKLKADLDKIEKNTATALTGIFNGLSNGSISYVRGGIGIRTDEDSNSFSLSTPSNMTYEIGIEGFYMGFGLPESIYDEFSGFSWLAGIDYFIFEGYEGFNLDFGLNAEFGMGNMDATDYNDGRYETNYTEDAIFYSFGAQIMLGKVVYVSYNYGFYNGDSKTIYSDSKSSVEEKGSGNFTKLGFGLALSF